MAGWTQKALAEKVSGMDSASAIAWLIEIGPETGGKADKLLEIQLRRLTLQDRERARLSGLRSMEADLWREGFRFVGGIDEAGRGPLAGPVAAACVILPGEVWLDKLDDSKKLSASVRERLYGEIRGKAAAWGVGICDSGYIDKVNILNATKKAMMLAVGAMKISPDALIIDALRLDMDIRQVSVPRADSLCAAVSAASVMAKVTRDRLMDAMDARYPQYGFIRNKGYGTAEHMEAIRKYGLSPIHRRSFTRGILSGEGGSDAE
jgi:ribonuclease HII